MNYLGRRLLRATLLLIGVSALCFLFTEMAPGSFFDEMRLNPQISPQTIATFRSHYGLDQPLVLRYGHWMKSALHGDLGYSIAYKLPVAPLLWARTKNTLLLTTTALLLTWLLSIPLALCAANRSGGFVDRTINFVCSFLLAVPELVIAVALLATVVRWRVLPVGGVASADFDGLSASAKLQEVLLHLALPVFMLVLCEIPVIIRHLRASVLEVLSTPYVQAARGLGVGRARLLYRHVLPVAANPAISLLGFSLAGLLSGSLIIEVVCGWPGLGPLILEATLSRDLYLVIGGIMFSALFMVGGTLVADVMLLAMDPRIRKGGLDAH
jgi:peptide/nickel transport system permease protein